MSTKEENKFLRKQISEVFGDTLRELRSKKGISQEKLALDAGINRGYISLLERGLRHPSLTFIFLIAKILELSPSEIVKLIELQVTVEEE
jgi:transcriptional regulator with XRE-family HTH domain